MQNIASFFTKKNPTLNSPLHSTKNEQMLSPQLASEQHSSPSHNSIQNSPHNSPHNFPHNSPHNPPSAPVFDQRLSEIDWIFFNTILLYFVYILVIYLFSFRLKLLEYFLLKNILV